MVQRDQCPLLLCTGVEERLVRDASHPLLAHRDHVVARGPQQVLAALPDVLIELEPHATRSVGTGMMRSLAASAP